MHTYKLHRFILPLFVLALLLTSCGGNSNPSPGNVSSGTASTTSSTSPKTVKFDGQILTGKHMVTLKTSKGDIEITVDADAAPKTATNFVDLAKAGFYDNLTFHRVIPTFMIQGGDPNGDGTGGQSVFGPTFEDEINAVSYGLDKMTLKDLYKDQAIPEGYAKMTLKEYYESLGYVYNNKLKSLPMDRGSVAMANRGPNTNGSQFFIMQGQNIDQLKGKYTVFGTVTKGMDVVDAIAAVERDGKDKPLAPVTFTAVVK